jgi:hypothetical protein
MMTFIEGIKSILDSIPMGTLIALAGIGCVLYAFITGTINIEEAFKYLGLASGSAAVVGIMRTHAGKGL